jgi:hypothetical protein
MTFYLEQATNAKCPARRKGRVSHGLNHLGLKMNSFHSFEASVIIYRSTRCDATEALHLPMLQHLVTNEN